MQSFPEILLKYIPNEETIYYCSNYRNNKYILLTNKAIYYQVYKDVSEGARKSELNYRIEYNSIMRYRFYKEHNCILEIIYKPYLKISEFRIEISDFNYFRKLFDTIIYNYSNFRDNSNKFQKLFNLEKPIKINLSNERLNYISKKKKLLPITGIIFELILLLLFYLCFNYLKYNAFLFIILLILIIPIIAIIPTILNELKYLKKYSLNNYISIKLEEKGLTILGVINTEFIEFNSDFQIELVKIDRNLVRSIGLSRFENFDGFNIISSNNLRKYIGFGPIDNTIQWYNLIMYYFLEWKKQNGFLFSQKDLEKLKINKQEIEIVKISYKRRKSHYYDLKPVQIQTFDEISIDRNLMLEFSNIFDIDEKIIAFHKLNLNILKGYFDVIIMITIFFLALFCFISIGFDIFKSESISEILTILGGFCLIIDLCVYPSTKNYHNKWESNNTYIITDRRIILKKLFGKIIFEKKSINTISIYYKKFQKNYDIVIRDINLKRSLVISCIPRDLDLFGKIFFLRKIQESKV